MKTPSIATTKPLRRAAYVLVVIAVLAAPAVHQYRGLTLGSFNQLRYGTWTETAHLMDAIGYWLQFMERLSLNPETGRYNFPLPAPDASSFEQGLSAYHRGDPIGAVEHFEQDIAAQGPSEERLFWLAMSLLRKSEAASCLPHDIDPDPKNPFHLDPHHVMPCALPLRHYHAREAGSVRAAEVFETLLDQYDSKNRLYRWLLNFSHMTVGNFPESVPEHFRIDNRFTAFFYGERATAAQKRHPELSFVDKAPELGIDTRNTGRGVAVEDFDGDGFLDVVTGGSFETLRFYRNIDGRTFEDRTLESGLGDVSQPFIITAADYNNDGWMDLFVSRPFDCFVLLKNLGDGTFEDVTAQSGLLDSKADPEVAATWVSAWSDVDRDGDLDLFLAQWAFRLPFVDGLMARPRMDSKLFINQGQRFEDGTAAFGLDGEVRDQYLLGATFGDVDNDGDPDLYVSSPLPGFSRLFVNRDGQRFEASARVETHDPAFVSAWVDVDHDGHLDLFRGGFGDARTSTDLAVFGDPEGEYRFNRSSVLRQGPDGRLVEDLEISDEMPMGTMGSSYGDLNNDGCHDFYLGTGNPESWFMLPNLMYLGQSRNGRCIGQLENISNLHGWGTIQKGHGIVFFDFDRDGDQDVYSSLGGMWPSDRWPNQFFINESRLDHAWIQLRLRGRKTNRFGVGARIRVEAVRADGSPLIRHHHMDNKTGFGSAPYLAHIGLLDAVDLRHIEVFWPVSRCRHIYHAELGRLSVLDEAACNSAETTEEHPS